MEMSHEGSSKALFNEYQEKPQLTTCKTVNNSQKRSSSSELETSNQYQQETELTKSQELCASGAEALQELSDSEGESDSDSTSELYEESSFQKSLKEIDLNRYRDLYLAALKADWETVKMIIDKNPEALTAKISMLSTTVLHVAAYSCNYEFVKKLVKKMTPQQVAVQDVSGNTALHYAAFKGAVDVAKVLLEKNPDLTEVQGSLGFIPLLSAVVHGAAKGKAGEEMVRFLASRTNNPFLQARTSTHLLLELTHAGFHDITLGLLHRFPHMATANIEGENILSVLAVKPMDFLSGTRLCFWETWIYNLAPCKPVSCAKGDMEDPLEIFEDPKDSNSQARATQVCKWFKQLLWKIITTLAPRTCQNFLDVKRRHKYASKLATFICERATEMPNEEILSYFGESRIVNLAGSSGIVEIIKTCLHHFPDLIWIWYGENDLPTVLDDAIEHRRELVFNLLYARSELCTIYGPLDENGPFDIQDFVSCHKPCRMHLAGKLAPAPQLSSVSGTALQMQRELQWYKEAEKIAHPSEKEKKDDEGYTPRELFTKEHKELVEKAGNG